MQRIAQLAPFLWAMQPRFSLVSSLVFVTACAGGTSGSGGSGGAPGQGGASSGGNSGTAQTGGVSSSSGGAAGAGASSGGTASGGSTSGGSASGGSASGGVSTSGGSSQGGSSAAQGGAASGGAAITSGGTAGAGVGGSVSGGRASGGAAGSSTSGGTTASSGGAGGAQSGGAGGSGGGTASACVEGSVGAYFVDSAAGNDSSNGTSPATAWRSLSKVNATTFQAGNRICFKAGSSFTGQLWPKGSGKSGSPIVIDQYGSGAKPIIAAGSSDTETVRLFNQQYWEITNLEVTNKKSALGDYRGIAIIGQNGGTLNHVYVKSCNVHDVTGHVNWIGGDVADNLTGVTFQTGWDASKRTGGIVFDVQAGTGTAVKTLFNDVLIEGNTVQNTSFGGIIFKQLDGSVHWGVRSSASDTNWTPHTNVTIRGNYLSQLNTDYGCNGIYMTDVKGGLIENNVVNGAGTSAIEL
ncbi:MAG: hypothetical protein QM756_06725 [Polyangiaceae bacterium]